MPPMIEPLGQGLLEDLRRKRKVYVSELKDGMSLQCFAATVFLFFACLAPAVAFGGLLGTVTLGQMGAMEMIVATAGSGMGYALLSGQPLTIIGSTGPVLAFIAVLYRGCARFSLPFLPFYAWVGLWSSGFLAVSSLTSASNAILRLTRFTDEIFANLISAIFIFEAASDLRGLFLSPAVPAAYAFTSLCAALTTFGGAMALRGARASPYLRKRARNAISDFAPTLGILGGVAVAAAAKARYAVALPCLSVPLKFGTTCGRPWLVPLLQLPVWARWAAAVPAVMATVLLFFDQTITARIVNAEGNKLKKGSGYHLDAAVISVVTAVCSVLGLPWLVAATVRSMNHVNALGKYDVKDGKATKVGVAEQRLSGLAIHSLIGAAILTARPLLRQIPLSVLMGLFLYLGTSALDGNQMFARLKLFGTDPELVPKDAPWANGTIKTRRVHLFTGIQMVCLGGMMWLKDTPAGIMFPVVIAMLGPVRTALKKFGVFSAEELVILDSD